MKNQVKLSSLSYTYIVHLYLCNLLEIFRLINSFKWSYITLIHLYYLQTIPKADYEKWAKAHLEAESSLEDREEKLMDSACRIESELELLGATGMISIYLIKIYTVLKE